MNPGHLDPKRALEILNQFKANKKVLWALDAKSVPDARFGEWLYKLSINELDAFYVDLEDKLKQNPNDGRFRYQLSKVDEFLFQLPKSILELRDAAEAGNIAADVEHVAFLARMDLSYYAAAKESFLKAAPSFPKASYYLATLLALPEDESKSFLEEGIKRGCYDSRCVRAGHYLKGTGGYPQDKALALADLEMAAVNGASPALSQLGQLLAEQGDHQTARLFWQETIKHDVFLDFKFLYESYSKADDSIESEEKNPAENNRVKAARYLCYHNRLMQELQPNYVFMPHYVNHGFDSLKRTGEEQHHLKISYFQALGESDTSQLMPCLQQDPTLLFEVLQNPSPVIAPRYQKMLQSHYLTFMMPQFRFFNLSPETEDALSALSGIGHLRKGALEDMSTNFFNMGPKQNLKLGQFFLERYPTDEKAENKEDDVLVKASVDIFSDTTSVPLSSEAKCQLLSKQKRTVGQLFALHFFVAPTRCAKAADKDVISASVQETRVLGADPASPPKDDKDENKAVISVAHVNVERQQKGAPLFVSLSATLQGLSYDRIRSNCPILLNPVKQLLLFESLGKFSLSLRHLICQYASETMDQVEVEAEKDVAPASKNTVLKLA